MIIALEQIKELLKEKDYLTSVEIERILDDKNLTKEDEATIKKFLVDNNINIVEEDIDPEKEIPEDFIDNDDISQISDDDIDSKKEIEIDKAADVMYGYISAFLKTNNIKLDPKEEDEFLKEIDEFGEIEYTIECITNFLDSKGLNNNIDENSVLNLARKIKRENSRRFETSRYLNDSVKMYLADISKIHLYTPEEEQEMAQKIKKQREIVEKAKSEGSDKVEEEQTILSELEKEFASHNLRLVVSVAKHFCTNPDDFLDLIQEGNIGLQRAVEKFDVDKGFKFSTYATWWIKQAVTRSIADSSRTIRIPVHLHEKIGKLRKAERFLTGELGRTPTNEELAEQINETVEKVEELKIYSTLPVSLDSPLKPEDGDQDSLIIDFIKDESPNPEEETMKGELKKEVSKLLKSIKNERFRRVLINRFGLYEGNYSAEEMEATRLRYVIATLPIEVIKTLPEPIMEDVIRNMTSRNIEVVKDTIIENLPEDIKTKEMKRIKSDYFKRLTNAQRKQIYVTLFGDSILQDEEKQYNIDFRIKNFFEDANIENIRALCIEKLSSEEKTMILLGMTQIEKAEFINNLDVSQLNSSIKFAKRIIDIKEGGYRERPLRDYASDELNEEHRTMINIINNDPYKDLLKDNDEYTDACIIAKNYKDMFNKTVYPSTLLYIKDKFKKRYTYASYKFSQGRPSTLDDVGQLEDVTRERIRQIEGKAKRELSLKQKSKVNSLKGYIINN